MSDERDDTRAARGPRRPAKRRVVYCLVPADLATKLHEPLREHFAEEPGVEVVVERRGADRRVAGERRGRAGQAPKGRERRQVRARAGRRVADRRAAQVPTATPELPRRARRYAELLLFVERVEPAEATEEDREAARIVARVQAGDPDAFSVLYTRYFERVFAYMRVALHDRVEAEDATQDVFVKAFAAIPKYKPQRPFRSWLFTIARNQALNTLRDSGRLEPMDPEELERQVEANGEEEELAPPALEWITDRDLSIFVERLPQPQRQALFLRYVLDLDAAEIGQVMERSVDDVRALQSRAVRFLRERLAAIGRAPTDPSRRIKMQAKVPEATVLRARRFSLH